MTKMCSLVQISCDHESHSVIILKGNTLPRENNVTTVELLTKSAAPLGSTCLCPQLRFSSHLLLSSIGFGRTRQPFSSITAPAQHQTEDGHSWRLAGEHTGAFSISLRSCKRPNGELKESEFIRLKFTRCPETQVHMDDKVAP